MNLFKIAVITCLVVVANSVAQKPDPYLPKSPPDSTKLPKAFAKFTAADVLSQIFDGYDPKTGTTNALRGKQGEPALARIQLAEVWYVNGQRFLVALTQITLSPYDFGTLGLCGNCTAISPIAVLRETDGRLELVAKQDIDSDASVGSDFRPYFIRGHDIDFGFDLAPYRLNSQEMLIGIRSTHMWIPSHTFSTALTLLRIEGKRLRNVFEEIVVDRSWPAGPQPDRLTIEKTVSRLAMAPNSNGFNKIVTSKSTFECLAKRDEYDCEGGRKRRTEREVWRFDGVRFVEANDKTGSP